jgi:hypothetical protein
MVGRFVGPVGLGAVLALVDVVLVPGTIENVEDEVIGIELIDDENGETADEEEDVRSVEEGVKTSDEEAEDETLELDETVRSVEVGVKTADEEAEDETLELDETARSVEEEVETVGKEAEEILVEVEDRTLELDETGGGIESRPGVYFVRS